MASLTADEVVQWTRGTVVRGTVRECRGVFTDSRRPLAQGLFVALRGERYDGHDFVVDSAQGGAAGAVVAEGRGAQVQEQLAALGAGATFFLVEVTATLAALQGLGLGHRRKFGGPVVGVTGSNGKTTTKEMISACLRTQTEVLATHRNYNNEIGLPLTLLGLRPEHGVCVVEMATRGLGQIAQLAAVAEPDVGVVTNVGPVHLETLGSIDSVARAKAELVAALSGEGTAVLNADDPLVAAMAADTRARVITYGVDNAAGVEARSVRRTGKGSDFSLWVGGAFCTEVHVSLPGMHNVSNALAALATTAACGFDMVLAASALADLPPVPMRLEIASLPGNVTLVNDAYNASPLSMKAALAVLDDLPGARRVAVLGDMLELGTEHRRLHEQVGQFAAQAALDFLVAIGQGGRLMAQGAHSAGFPGSAAQWYPDAASAAAAVGEWMRPGDCVLVKASRGMRLETVASAIAAYAKKMQAGGSWRG